MVARVAIDSPAASNPSEPVTRVLGAVVGFGAWGLACAALVLALCTFSRTLRRRMLAGGMTGLMLAASCASPQLGSSRSAMAATAHPTFFHNGFGSGPVAFSDADGHLLEERRYEPFGAPIDARVHTDAGYVIGTPDLVTRDLNPLNKRSDASTGWSDHGARWLLPETGRWLSTDPPVAGPDSKFMFAPWTLHPYQYVNQNPTQYWDPSGNDGAPVPLTQPVWAPTPPVPGPPTPPAPVNAPAVEATAGRAGLGVTAASTAAFVTVLFWPREAGRGSTCDAPGSCGEREDRRRRGKEKVNLDVGVIVNATQLSDIPGSMLINRYLADKIPVITKTALNEFLNGKDGKPGTFSFAGPLERLYVYQLLARSMIIPDNPSERVMDLVPDSNRSKKVFTENDKNIFGTGDRYNMTTYTVDRAFDQAAKARGVDLDIKWFRYLEYSGR